jgi:D-threonate/D-erythronate kinase
MTAVRVLADDLTGALDTAAEFARMSGPMHAFWHEGLPEHLPASAAIDTGTREQDVGTARAVVGRFAPMLSAGRIAYKKVDSLMRGATVAEIASCFATGGWRSAVFAPAFPFQGRMTRGGQQWARGEAGWRPVGPPLVEALRAEGVVAQLGRLDAGLSPGISVFDADTDEVLAAIAALPPDDVLWCGTGGLARALAGVESVASDDLPRPVLGLFGSDQPATFAQLAACAPHWFQLEDGVGLDESIRALAQGLALLSVALPPGILRDEAARRIGCALHRAVTELWRPGTLLVAGGETLRFLCRVLGATSLELEGRIQPGLPRAVLRGGRWDGVTIVSKSGAFGPPHLLWDLLARNAFYPQRTDR